jgi:hypothetical protein
MECGLDAEQLSWTPSTTLSAGRVPLDRLSVWLYVPSALVRVTRPYAMEPRPVTPAEGVMEH